MVATLLAWERHSPTAQVAQSSTSPVLTPQVSKQEFQQGLSCCACSHNKPSSFPSTHPGCSLHLFVDAALPQGCPRSSRSGFGAEVAFATPRHHPALAQNPPEPCRVPCAPSPAGLPLHWPPTGSKMSNYSILIISNHTKIKLH